MAVINVSNSLINGHKRCQETSRWNQLSEQQIPRMLADEEDEVRQVANIRLSSTDTCGLTIWQATGHSCPVYLMSYESLLMMCPQPN